MSRKHLVSMVGGTITCALAIGFFMQRGETSAPRNLIPMLPPPVQQAVLEPAITTIPASLTTANTGIFPEKISVAGLASSPAPTLIAPSLPSPTLQQGAPVKAAFDGAAMPVDPGVPQLGCDVSATATANTMAMVDLEISAPCFGNERVTIHHNGMMFTQATDEAGQLSVSVPALSDRAVFIVAFAGGNGTVALTNVPEMHNYERVVVQWTGDVGFQIHAREFGAAYGEAGHVWSGVAPGARQGIGFVTRLGDPETTVPQMAEIYTFPSGAASMSGTVALSVEAEVTRQNCGREITAQSLEMRQQGPLRTRDLVLAMPDCSAVGDFLVLNNLVNDLSIAAR